MSRSAWKFFHNTCWFSTSLFLTMLKTFQRICSFILWYDTQTFFHFQVYLIDLKNAWSNRRIEDKQSILESKWTFFYSMPDNLFNPHFDSFPTSKSGKEFQLFDFLINLFFFQPFLQVNKLNGFTTKIMTKPLFTNRIILKVGIFIFLLDLLIVNNFQLINILLLRLWLWWSVTNKVQKLIYIWYVF